uniref:Uncharacterized protein n=1 Tax=Arundo donax TaxID=35708 RepID=A0A0A9F2Q3_ARUDO
MKGIIIQSVNNENSAMTCTIATIMVTASEGRVASVVQYSYTAPQML